jgi:hypothetical protein
LPDLNYAGFLLLAGTLVAALAQSGCGKAMRAIVSDAMTKTLSFTGVL